MTVYIDNGNITASLASITSLLNQLIKQGVQEMTVLDDLNNAVAAVQAADTANQQADAAIQAAVNNAITLIQSLHTGTGTVSDAEVEAAVAALQTAAADNTKATTDYNTAATNLAGAKPQP